MTNRPYSFGIEVSQGRPTRFDTHIRRTLSALSTQFASQEACSALLRSAGDVVLYEVYELTRPKLAGELLHGLSIVHPGKVGDEYFMTKGHYHAELETAEVYHCLRGVGMMVMETPDGEWAVEPLLAGAVLYVPPCWAHRSVNTAPDEDLITFFVYPGNAGHDYATIENQGFRKLVVERDGRPLVIDNARWRAPMAR